MFKDPNLIELELAAIIALCQNEQFIDWQKSKNDCQKKTMKLLNLEIEVIFIIFIDRLFSLIRISAGTAFVFFRSI